MTLYRCHCGEVHDNANPPCPQVFTFSIDDWQSRLATAALEFIRAGERFWTQKGRDALAEYNRRQADMIRIVAEREVVPRLSKLHGITADDIEAVVAAEAAEGE